jgi:hypothetical protein
MHHPTPVCFDYRGSYGKRAEGDTSGGGACFSSWAHFHWKDHMITEAQRLAYNVRQLGVDSAADFERKYQKTGPQR